MGAPPNHGWIRGSFKGGVNRQALSAEDIGQENNWWIGAPLWDLAASHDPAGNLFLRLQGIDVDATPLLCGSHLDSQPTGGKFDGVYGVLAALEAVQVIAEVRQPRHSIEVGAWMERGRLTLRAGMMGSAVFAGARSLENIVSVKTLTALPSVRL